jgi:Tol biopolymer transport system component
MHKKGETWNESEAYADAVTLRQVRRMTRNADYNMTPNYHTNTGFSVDGEFLVFVSQWSGGGAILRCHVPTGDLTQVTDRCATIGAPVLAPKSGWAVFSADGAVRAVHIHTLEERTLCEVKPHLRIARPSVDGEEVSVVFPTHPVHPEIAAGCRPGCGELEYFTEHGVAFSIVQVPLAGGEAKTVYHEEGCRCSHIPHCPTDGDVLLIDRDFPPRFHAGSDGKTNRIWLLRLSTGELTELPSLDGGTFQVHCAWTFDGRHVVYHGHGVGGGWFIGVTDRQGQVVREWSFTQMEHYGHVSAAAPGRSAIILDGNLSTDLLLWLYYDAQRPRIEVIARHATDWTGAPGQLAHPHPLADPTGRWISFNAAKGKRSDVFVVRV